MAWLYTTTGAHFAAARAEGLETTGLLVASSEEALRVHEGDPIAVLLTDGPAFAAACERKAAGEAPPKSGTGAWIPVQMRALCAEADPEPAGPLATHLEFPKAWPETEWASAAAGTLREISARDADLIRLSCRARERGHPRPPGAAPTEAERPPKIPAKLRRPSAGPGGA